MSAQAAARTIVNMYSNFFISFIIKILTSSYGLLRMTGSEFQTAGQAVVEGRGEDGTHSRRYGPDVWS